MPIFAKSEACLVFPSRKRSDMKTSKSLKEHDHSMEMSVSLHGKSGSVIRVIWTD